MPTRIRNIIGTWSGRHASHAGREILLKSVAQVVPMYSMSCFLLSKTTCRKMKSPIANYWWGAQLIVRLSIGRAGRDSHILRSWVEWVSEICGIST
jgi:hypothetical protein